MRMKTILVVSLLLMTSALVSADTFELVLSPGNCGTGASCDSFTFTTQVTPLGSNLYDLNFKVSNSGRLVGSTTVYDPAYLQGFSLTLFSGTFHDTSWSADPTLASSITVQVFDSAKYKNGSDSCGTGTHPGSICLDVTSANGIYIGANQYQSFDFQLTLLSGGLLTDSWHVMAVGTKLPNGKGGNVFALSNDGTPIDPPTKTPEPASIMLLASGLVGLARLLHHKLPNC